MSDVGLAKNLLKTPLQSKC